MPRFLVIAFFLVIAGSIALLIKWEFKRFRRREHRESKAFTRNLAALRDAEPGRAYTPRPEAAKRAFEL